MKQLMMYWLAGTQTSFPELPEGVSVRRYCGGSDVDEWLACCRNGLIADDAGEEVFRSCIQNAKDIQMESDVFFLDWNGQHVGTVTAIYHPDGCWGEMHMVGIKMEFRGRGLGKHLNAIAVQKLSAQNIRYIELTTDEWRKPAIRSYLAAGFLPVEYDEGMPARWESVLAELGVGETQMVDKRGLPCRILRKGC